MGRGGEGRGGERRGRYKVLVGKPEGKGAGKNQAQMGG
jgi:hypothetical protein